MTSEGSFEPTVIFFELTNSPAIFQTIDSGHRREGRTWWGSKECSLSLKISQWDREENMRFTIRKCWQ